SVDHNPISLDDMNFLEQLKIGIHKTPNGHYEMPLPFRNGSPELPSNKLLALRRLQGLKTRLQKDQRYHQHYKSFMNDLLQRGYAEPVPEVESNKPDKLRVVFDCGAIPYRVFLRRRRHVPSVPRCANYGLKAIAENNKQEFGEDVANFVKRDFYVDDGLKSLKSVPEAVSIIHKTKDMLSRRLVYNFSIDRASNLKDLDFNDGPLPVERTLGTQWCIESDSFKLRIILQLKPCTRRGILSTISSIYDPLGFAAPFLLIGRQILQDLCRDQADWDDPVPEEVRQRWEKFRRDLLMLDKLKVPRCVAPTGFEECSYIRLVNSEQEVHCAFIMGKSRVAPLKHITIPRLELSAALVAVKQGGQWNHVESEDNPADDASRGLKAEQLVEDTRWLNGPAFLWKPDLQLPTQQRWMPADDDPEVKKVKSLATATVETKCSSMLDRLNYFSCWYRARRAIANCMNLKNRLKCRISNRSSSDKQTKSSPVINVEDLQRAESEIIQMVQEKEFPEEMKILRSLQKKDPNRKETVKIKASLKKTSCLYRLEPFLDPCGVLRVGGRLKKSDLPYHVKHPAVLPRKGHLTTLIIRHYHQKTAHQGRGMTVNELRSNGYWIIGGSSAVGYYISDCVACQKRRGNVQEQKMADLPEDRMKTEAPFTYCGVDYFGPWLIKEGRKELKRYGVLFTCLSSRAIHIEVAKTLETSSFINVLRCFLARRGPIRQLRSDQGTNLVGARTELREILTQMDQNEVQQFLLKRECDWFEFKLNTPTASHAGGVWERMIRTVRSVLDGLLEQHGTQLDEESLRTLLCEVECIVNSRPIAGTNTPEEEPLTPNHLLTMKMRNDQSRNLGA
ncbi:uncharacterized protein LOC110985605, partial [Paramuricea clavata]